MGLFKTLATLILMHRWVPNGHFSGPIGNVLGADWFLVVVGVLAAIEIIMDIVPGWDVRWQKWNGHLRVVGALALSWIILSGEDFVSRVIMVIVGLMLVVISYTAIVSARRAAHRGGTARLVTPVASVTENCMFIATLVPLTRLAPMTLLMILFMTGAAMLIIYVLRTEAREVLQWLFNGRWIEPTPKDTSGTAEQAED